MHAYQPILKYTWLYSLLIIYTSIYEYIYSDYSYLLEIIPVNGKIGLLNKTYKYHVYNPLHVKTNNKQVFDFWKNTFTQSEHTVWAPNFVKQKRNPFRCYRGLILILSEFDCKPHVCRVRNPHRRSRKWHELNRVHNTREFEKDFCKLRKQKTWSWNRTQNEDFYLIK